MLLFLDIADRSTVADNYGTMPTTTHKAIQRTQLRAEDCAAIQRNAQNATFREVINATLENIRAAAIRTADKWLALGPCDKSALDGVWVRLSGDYREIVTTWTFNDRDAALLFKLSLV